MSKWSVKSVKNKELKKILITAEREGGLVELRNNGHLKVTMPNGKIVFLSQTPSDVRALPRIVRDFKRIGYDLKGKL